MPAEIEERTKTLPFAMKHLPDYFKEKARRELNETPEKRITALKELKEMAKDNKLTCDIHFVDDFLLQFLRHRKYDVSRAFKQLVNFTVLRKDHSYLFLSIDDNIDFGEPCRQFCTVLPRRCPDGCTIILLEHGKWDSDLVSFQELKQMGMMLLLQTSRDPMTQINGYKVIHDYTGAPLKHLKYCTPSNLYLFYHGSVNCLPGRWKAVHVVSDSLVMKTTWTVIKPFVAHKMKQRIFVSSSRKDLLNHFPPSVLPVKYGGVLEDYYMTEWVKVTNKQQKEFGLQGQCNYY